MLDRSNMAFIDLFASTIGFGTKISLPLLVVSGDMLAF